MPIIDCRKITVNSAVRNAWRVTLLIFLFFVLMPFVFSLYLKSQGADRYDPNINILGIITALGGVSSLSFLFISFMFSRARKMASASPNRMCISIKVGLVITFIYWALFFYLTLSGTDGDGIMRGWTCILFPYIFIPSVLMLSRD